MHKRFQQLLHEYKLEVFHNEHDKQNFHGSLVRELVFKNDYMRDAIIKDLIRDAIVGK